MKEEWKEVPGYEGLYQVSNFGNVKACAKIDGKGIVRKERLLKPFTTPGGYYRIFLMKNEKRKGFLVHRLVAMAFIPNPDNLPFINHKDECGLNNCVDNLEWCDRLYNVRYGTAIERKKRSMINGKHSKRVGQFDMNEILIRVWVCAAEYERETGNPRTSIYNCANGKQKTAYGYKWSYL